MNLSPSKSQKWELPTVCLFASNLCFFKVSSGFRTIRRREQKRIDETMIDSLEDVNKNSWKMENFEIMIVILASSFLILSMNLSDICVRRPCLLSFI